MFGLSIITFLVVLTVLVFVHEMGHYLVARWCGVRVDVFSIGFGRELVGWNDKSGTRWKVSMIPLGGYVKFSGDEDAASRPSAGAMADTEDDGNFHTKPLWQRAAVVFAGPAVNYIFAAILFAGMFMTYGVPSTTNRISAVVENSAAAEAGLMPGDRIVAMNDQPIERFEDLRQFMALNLDRPVDATIERDGRVLVLPVRPHLDEQKDSLNNTIRRGLLGVRSERREMREVGVAEATWEGAAQTITMTAVNLEALWDIVTGHRSSDEISGPIGIARMTGQAAEISPAAVINIMAVISVGLGMINLFPIPMLDGGHLLFYAIEAIKRKPMSERAQEFSFKIGFALVISLMVFATVNDIQKAAAGLLDGVLGWFS